MADLISHYFTQVSAIVNFMLNLFVSISSKLMTIPTSDDNLQLNEEIIN